MAEETFSGQPSLWAELFSFRLFFFVINKLSKTCVLFLFNSWHFFGKMSPLSTDPHNQSPNEPFGDLLLFSFIFISNGKTYGNQESTSLFTLFWKFVRTVDTIVSFGFPSPFFACFLSPLPSPFHAPFLLWLLTTLSLISGVYICISWGSQHCLTKHVEKCIIYTFIPWTVA